MKSLPKNVASYKKTNVFDQDSIPKGVLNNHQTLKGVWAKINVVEGNLLYVIQTDPIEEVHLDKEHSGVVEPTVFHHVKPIGKVKFYVEFYK